MILESWKRPVSGKTRGKVVWAFLNGLPNPSPMGSRPPPHGPACLPMCVPKASCQDMWIPRTSLNTLFYQTELQLLPLSRSARCLPANEPVLPSYTFMDKSWTNHIIMNKSLDQIDTILLVKSCPIFTSQAVLLKSP